MRLLRSGFVVALAVLAAACSRTAPPVETSVPAPTVPSTSTSRPRVIVAPSSPPTSTTTLPSVTVDGAPPELAELISGLYRTPFGAPPPPMPDGLAADLAAALPQQPPASATAAVGSFGPDVTLAVVEAADDVTLAVADPEWRVVGGWWPSLGVGAHLGEYPKTVAVVGSDARPHERRDETRTDSIHFVVIAEDGPAGIVSVPRDSWVEIPAHGKSRINAALVYGGTKLMMETFESVSGLDFDGYLLTGFKGFEGLIDVLGGLRIDVPRDLVDPSAKANLKKGLQTLGPKDALALARVRKSLPRGDFDRAFHGGLMLRAAQAQLRAEGPLRLPGLLSAARPHFSTSFAPDELLVLAASVLRVDPALVSNVVAPGRAGMAGKASVVFLDDSAAELFSDLSDGHLESVD